MAVSEERSAASPEIERATLGINLRWFLILAYGAFILIGANDGAVGVLLPSFQQYYAVDKATISLLFLAGTTGYLCAAFSTGLLVERLGQRRFLLLGVGLFLGGAAVFSSEPPFVGIIVLLVAMGFGVAIIDAGLNAYIAALPDNTALLNYLHAFYGLGALIGPLVAAGILALAWGWNAVYLVWVAISTVLLVGLAVVFRGSPPHVREAGGGAGLFMQTLRLRVVGLAAGFLLVYVGAEVSLGQWSYSLLTEERGEATLSAGWMVSGYWMGLTVGRVVLGRVAARLGNRRLIQWCLAGVVAGVGIVWLEPGSLGAAVGLWLAGFSLGPIFPTTIAMLSDLVPARLLAGAVGFVASAGSIGAALFPWIAGNLAEGIGLWMLLPYVMVLTVAMLLLWVALQGQRAGKAELPAP